MNTHTQEVCFQRLDSSEGVPGSSPDVFQGVRPHNLCCVVVHTHARMLAHTLLYYFVNMFLWIHLKIL